MQMPGPTELILVLLIVLIIFGASRLPEIGKGLGKMLREFKKATGEDTEEKKLEEKQKDEQQ